MQYQPPDRIGRASAVIEQFRIVRITGFHDVLRERIEQIVKELQWKLVVADDLRQIGKQW